MNKLLFLPLCAVILFSCSKEIIPRGASQAVEQAVYKDCGTVEGPYEKPKTTSFNILQPNSSAAPFTVKIEWDGYNYAGGAWGAAHNFNASGEPQGFRDVVMQYLAEDWRSFNVTFTTDEAVYTAAGAGHRQRVVITTGEIAYLGNFGGIAKFQSAIIGSINLGEPCFIEVDLGGNYTYRTGTNTSHELGHTLGLHHHQDITQGTCTFNAEYLLPIGNPSVVAWRSIMGNGDAAMTTFAQGAAYNYTCGFFEDQYTIINQTISYVADPDPNVLTGINLITVKKATLNGAAQAINIGYPGDIDIVRLMVTSGASYRIIGTTLQSAVQNNLDLQLDVYVANSATINTPVFVRTLEDAGTADINDVVAIPAGYSIVFVKARAQGSSPYALNPTNNLQGYAAISVATP